MYYCVIIVLLDPMTYVILYTCGSVFSPSIGDRRLQHQIMPHRRSDKEIEALCEDWSASSLPKHTPRHVAVVFQGTQRVCTATNGNGPVGHEHAEQAAIRMLRAQTLSHHRSLRLYVTKVGGIHSFSRPCVRCSRLLARYPWIRVYYTDHQGAWVEDSRLDSTHMSIGDSRRLLERS